MALAKHKFIPCLWFDKRAEEAARVMNTMKKLDLAEISRVYMGEAA